VRERERERERKREKEREKERERERESYIVNKLGLRLLKQIPTTFTSYSPINSAILPCHKQKFSTVNALV
jgi:hypothetical protein